LEDHQMIIPGHFGFNCPSGFREEAFWNIFPIGTTTAGHSFYIGPIGSFYNQVNDTGSWEPLVMVPDPCWETVRNSNSTIWLIRHKEKKSILKTIFPNVNGLTNDKRLWKERYLWYKLKQWVNG
jgi:hypothetical protein